MTSSAAGNSTMAAITTTLLTTSSSPLPPITTKEPRPDIAEQIKLTVDDLVIAGDLLGVVVMISIIMNIYTIFVVSKNWKNFVQFPFSQSNIICMFLSFADLLLGLLLGLPTAIHMRFADYFSEQHPKVMVHYSRVAGYFLLDYMFLFRSIIIAIICIDRCVHILRPLAYKIWVSNRLTIGIIAGMTIFPLLARVIPQIIFLNIRGKTASDISCSSFRNPDADESAVLSTVDSLNFTVPLSCAIHIWLDGVKIGLGAEKTKNSWPGRVAAAEMVLYICTLVFTFLSIVIGNIIILVVIIRRFRVRKSLTCHTNQDPNVIKSKVKQSIQKNLMATSIMAFVFLISNGPMVVIWLVDYLTHFLVKLDIGKAWRSGDDKMRLYLTMCMFLSLLVNPWLYPLRMETIRKFFPCLKRPLSTTLRDTRTQIFSSIPGLSRKLNSPKTGKKINLCNPYQKSGYKSAVETSPLPHLKEDSVVVTNSKTIMKNSKPVMTNPEFPSQSLSLKVKLLSSPTEVIELEQIEMEHMCVRETEDNYAENVFSPTHSAVVANIYATEMEI